MKVWKRLFVLILAVILSLCLVACGAKTPKTTQEFTQYMEENDFTVVDSTLFAQTAVTANTVLSALNDNYQIEFYDIDCDATAKQFYQLNKTAFEQDATAVTTSEKNSDNYDSYYMVTDTDFCLTSRIDNTVIYCYTDVEYKDEILKLVEDLGY